MPVNEWREQAHKGSDKRSVERGAIETTSEKKVNKGTRDGRRSGVEVRSVSAPNRNARLTLCTCGSAEQHDYWS